MIVDLLLQNDRKGLPHKLATLRHGEGLGQAYDMTVRRVVRDGFHIAVISEGLFEKKLLGDVVDVDVDVDVGIGVDVGVGVGVDGFVIHDGLLKKSEG
jgi:hypothetical protein